MLGLMQNWQLNVSKVIQYAQQNYGSQQIISQNYDDHITQLSYKEVEKRMRCLAWSLRNVLGLERGDVVATMAWNNIRHFEIWYAVMGSDMVCHTVNPRLFKDQIRYIINHAQDKYIFIERSFIPILKTLAHELATLKGIIVLTKDLDPTESDGFTIPFFCYEDLIGEQSIDEWPEIDENNACALCYTSGTTGNPKGVCFSQRALVLHAMAVNGGNFYGLTHNDTVLPVVPMFHANAWSNIFSAPMCGAKLVLPDRHLDPQSLYTLINSYQVTFSAGVPTVWLALLDYLNTHNGQLKTMTRIVIGGSACAASTIEAYEKQYNIKILHAWGMTEMSPIGTVSTIKPELQNKPYQEQLQFKAKQGIPIFTVEMKITDENGINITDDSTHSGHLMVRGPAIVATYFKQDTPVIDDDNYFKTGDIAIIDEAGYMQIRDRTKDLIKSGGEWISSIELENTALFHPGVAEAAAIAADHPKWGERPILLVVAEKECILDDKDILTTLKDHIVKWQLPDAIIVVDELPHTATGKLQKTVLREKYQMYLIDNNLI